MFLYKVICKIGTLFHAILEARLIHEYILVNLMAQESLANLQMEYEPVILCRKSKESTLALTAN